MNGAGALWRLPVFAAVALAAIYVPLTPFAPGQSGISGDLLFAVVFAWVLRDPGAAPVLAVAAVGVLADILLNRPIGLCALALVMASEVARGRRHAIRTRGFVFEFIVAMAVYAASLAVVQVMLRIAFAPAPDLATTLGLILETALLYPVVVAILVVAGRIFAISPALKGRA